MALKQLLNFFVVITLLLAISIVSAPALTALDNVPSPAGCHTLEDSVVPESSFADVQEQ